MKNLIHLDPHITQSGHQSAITNRASMPPAKAPPAYGSFFGLISFLLLALFLCHSATAFPPAPHHLIYGTVRDEMGNPLWVEGAAVILETSSGVSLRAEIVSGLDAGINYKLPVPLDAGVTSDAYRSIALRAAAPFKLRVQIGRSTYLPIEMSADFSKLGLAAESTRLDLTLGEDSNGNGLPDAWERALIAASGGQLAEINPNDDPDNDGLTNLQEYQAGTFAFDINDGFALKVIEMSTAVRTMEFMSIRGRTYTIFASSDLNDWTPVSFRLAGDSGESPDRRSYQAGESKVVQVSVSPSPAQSNFRFFKLRAE